MDLQCQFEVAVPAGVTEMDNFSIAASSPTDVLCAHSLASSPQETMSFHRHDTLNAHASRQCAEIFSKDSFSTRQHPLSARDHFYRSSSAPLGSQCSSSSPRSEESDASSYHRSYKSSTSTAVDDFAVINQPASYRIQTLQYHSTVMPLEDDVTSATAMTVSSEGDDKMALTSEKQTLEKSKSIASSSEAQHRQQEPQEGIENNSTNVSAVSGTLAIPEGENNLRQKSPYDKCFCPQYIYHNPYNLSRGLRLWLQICEAPFLILWVYFIYFLVIVSLTASQVRQIVWLNATLAGLLVGTGLNANAYHAVLYRGSIDYGMVLRFFFIPFGVSALSGLTNGMREKFMLVFPVDRVELTIAMCTPTIVVCLLLVSRLCLLTKHNIPLTLRNFMLNGKIFT